MQQGWEKESIHRPAPVRNFPLPEKWGPQRKYFGGRCVFPGFLWGFCIHHWPGKSFFEARKVTQKIFFRWWSCTFFFFIYASSRAIRVARALCRRGQARWCKVHLPPLCLLIPVTTRSHSYNSQKRGLEGTFLVTRIAATSKSQIASDCNRNSKKSLRLRKHPLKPTLWTRESPVLCGFYSVSEAPHGSGNPPEHVATTRV